MNNSSPLQKSGLFFCLNIYFQQNILIFYLFLVLHGNLGNDVGTGVPGKSFTRAFSKAHGVKRQSLLLHCAEFEISYASNCEKGRKTVRWTVFRWEPSPGAPGAKHKMIKVSNMIPQLSVKRHIIKRRHLPFSGCRLNLLRKKTDSNRYCLKAQTDAALLSLFIKGAVSLAGSVISTLKILCAKCIPASGTEDLFSGNIVKTYGNTKH